MPLVVNHHLWPALRRVGETKGRIAALEDIQLRLIEIGDMAAAEAMQPQMERLKKSLDYHRHVLVAVRARLSRTQPEPDAAIAVGLPWPQPRPPMPVSRSYGLRSPVALPEAEEVI